jgi:RHS repeat-associated protein
MPGSLVGWSAPPNKNLYNGGSEWQNDTKAVNAGVPDYYQTFYRNYDPALARFVAVDPMVEGAESMGVFQYAGDDPIMMNDPGGNKALPPGAWQNVAQDNAAQAAFQGPSDLAGGGGPSAEDVWQELRQGYGPDIIASGTSSDPNFLQNFVHDVGPYLISGALAMANSVNYSFNSDGQLISVNPNGLGHNTFTKQVITNLGTMTDPNTGYDWYQNVSITDVPITAEEAAAFGLTGADANQGGGGILGWIGNHFLEEGSYQLTVGYQFSGGIKHGVDATINLESSVLSEGKIGNRNVEGENKTYDNSKWTHELSLSWAGVGGGVKYTNNDNTEKELEFSAGILGFLGGKIAIDPSNGQVTNWFIGIDIDVHVAAIFGIDGEYKLGLAK